jgi:hypothetical protein
MEHIRTAKVENVKLVDKVTPKSSPVGTLYLTTSHLVSHSLPPRIYLCSCPGWCVASLVH